MPSRTPKSPSPPAAAPTPNTALASEAAYNRFLTAAQALPADAVEPCKDDPALCYQNIALGVKAVQAHADVVKTLPTPLQAKELAELPELALALGFAAAQVNRRSTGEVKPAVAQATQLRRQLLAAAESLVESGDVPARDLEAIKRGRGPADAAQDCIALAALFTKNEAARKKTPVTPEQVTAAGQVGTQLLSLLRPAGSRKRSLGEEQALPAVQIRDRLWSLLRQKHRELRRIGMWLWLDEVDAHVPALRSRRAAPRKKPAVPPK